MMPKKRKPLKHMRPLGKDGRALKTVKINEKPLKLCRNFEYNLKPDKAKEHLVRS